MSKLFKDLREFTSAQMTKLKKEYEPLKGKRLPVGAIDKMNIMLKKYSTDMLMKLAKGGIAFLSTAAKSELVINRGKKWTDFKEPLDMAEADELQQEACWVGYKQVGMKKKGDRQVPNCVKEELVEAKMQVQNLKTLPHRTAFRATIKKVLPSVVAYGSDSNPDFLTFVGSKSDLESLATMAKQYKVGPIRESMDDDCPTCNGGECQCATPEVGKVHECCGNEECICDSLEESIQEGKYLKYSNLLMKKAKELQAIDKAQNKSKVANPSLNAIKEIDKEIDKEMKRLGIQDEFVPEALKVKYDKTKQGWFDDKGRRRYLGNAATNALMKKKLDHAIKTGDWTSFDVSKEEIEFNFLEEGKKILISKIKDSKIEKDIMMIVKKNNLGISLSKSSKGIQADGNTKDLSKLVDALFDKHMDNIFNPRKEIDPPFEIRMEGLDSKDKETIEPIIKQLKKSVKAHDKQAKQLQKDISDDKELKEFTFRGGDNFVSRLKKEYEPLRGKNISKDNNKKLNNMLDRYSKDLLIKLANADIPFLSMGAASKLTMKHGMKFTDFKLNMSETDEFVPEADLTKTQIKMVHKKADDLPKNDFIKRYGKDGDSVRFATATNMVKKKLGVAENSIKGENEMNESYKDNFNAAMEELGINSLDELKSIEEQKAFFSYVDSLEEGLTAGQKKLPPALQKSILAKQGDKKEELSDKQKKMDMNKNGKIDGEDLAKLRAKKEEAVSPAQQAAIAISKKEKEMKKEEPYHPGTEGGMGEMMKKEMMKKMSKEMKELKAETDIEKMEMMKKEMMNAMKKEMADMDEMSETMKKEMMKEMKKKMDEYGSMNINAMKEMAEMKPMKKEMIKAMTDPKKMNAMTMQDPKQDMIKKHSNDDIKAMKTDEMDMAKNNDDTETPSMEMMKAMMMKKDEMMKKETAKKRMNAMKDANPMYAMKDAGKEMMNAMKKVQMNDKKKIQATYEKYLPTKEGSLEAAVLKSVSTKKTD